MKRIIFIVVLFNCLQAATAEEGPLVAVAANMMHVMNGIQEAYLEEGNNSINFVYSSSGNLARQILQGAPFELFLSANRVYVDFLIQNDIRIAGIKEFARGRIGYFIPKNSSLSNKTGLEEINKTLVNGEYHRIAIANPEFAPYGVAAEQALRTAGLWVIESDKLLLGENTAQAVQFSLSGGVDIGIIPSSYAVIRAVRDGGKFYLIPEEWHQPIIEYLVLLLRSGPEGKKFYNYLQSDKVRLILEKNGYTANTGPDD